MAYHLSYERSLPERKPQGHIPAAPRYTLRWNRPISSLVNVYFGIQEEQLSWGDEQDFHERLRHSFANPDGPDAHEIMRFTDEAGQVNGVVVAYWTDPTAHARWAAHSEWSEWFNSAARLEERFGYWCETMTIPYDRFETIYSGSSYKVGFARSSDCAIEAMTTNGYYGAARDRLPLSAIDALVSPHGVSLPVRRVHDSKRKSLLALNPHNLTFLRSGQFWEGAGQEQLDDYKNALEPKLHRGMQHIVSHREETGCLSLRIMSNLNSDGSPRQETSVAASFLSMEQLERWAASHQTHADIYKHAIAMNRLYKEKREVITWHELYVLMANNRYEYVNCHPDTGILAYSQVYEREP